MNAKGNKGGGESDRESIPGTSPEGEECPLLAIDALALERRSINRSVWFGVVIAVLVGVAGLLAIGSSGPDVVGSLLSIPLAFVSMGFAGSLWWWHGRESWSLWGLILLTLMGLALAAVASRGLEGLLMLALILMRLPLVMVMALLMFVGAKLGYRLRDDLAR